MYYESLSLPLSLYIYIFIYIYIYREREGERDIIRSTIMHTLFAQLCAARASASRAHALLSRTN